MSHPYRLTSQQLIELALRIKEEGFALNDADIESGYVAQVMNSLRLRLSEPNSGTVLQAARIIEANIHNLFDNPLLGG